MAEDQVTQARRQIATIYQALQPTYHPWLSGCRRVLSEIAHMTERPEDQVRAKVMIATAGMMMSYYDDLEPGDPAAVAQRVVVAASEILRLGRRLSAPDLESLLTRIAEYIKVEKAESAERAEELRQAVLALPS